MSSSERGFVGCAANCVESILGALVLDQVSLCNCLDLYHTPPDSGERQYKSRSRESRFDPAMSASVL